ncbi:MAG: hypothetical protein H6719_10140 [Sandaracinaceae bacterium]|nr:hypothetical protein [Sandaracinaceae bacterium]
MVALRLRGAVLGLVVICGCGGPGRPSDPSFAARDYSFGPLRVGDEVSEVLRRAPFADGEHCVDTSVGEERRLIAWAGRASRDCPDELPGATGVALVYRGAHRRGPVETVIWAGGPLLEEGAGFPGRVGMSRAAVEAALGPSRADAPLGPVDGITLTVLEHGPSVYSVLDGDTVIALAVGRMSADRLERDWAEVADLALRASPPVGSDRDGDGAADAHDRCPDAAGEGVDGCSTEPDAPPPPRVAAPQPVPRPEPTPAPAATPPLRVLLQPHIPVTLLAPAVEVRPLAEWPTLDGEIVIGVWDDAIRWRFYSETVALLPLDPILLDGATIIVTMRADGEVLLSVTGASDTAGAGEVRLMLLERIVTGGRRVHVREQWTGADERDAPAWSRQR